MQRSLTTNTGFTMQCLSRVSTLRIDWDGGMTPISRYAVLL